MKVIIGSDYKSVDLKNHLKKHLENLGYEVIDKTPCDKLNFVQSTSCVAEAVLSGEGERGIAIDEYGTGSFIVACKHKGIVCAQAADEHSAKMTRDHNNTSIITIGAKVTGEKIAERMAEKFLEAGYSGGRHQIRVDMLNKMA